MACVIERILAKSVVGPDGHSLFDPEINEIWIEDKSDNREVDFVEATLKAKPKRLLLLADLTTYEVLGRRVQQALSKKFECRDLMLPPSVQPEDGIVDRIAKAASGSFDAIIAVGSGTMNDLAKSSAARCKIPYLVFATAPSMNGYASRNASISVKGHKKTLAARPPRGIFVDLAISAQAPQRMIMAGLGDSLARSTAQTDWLLAHLVFDSPYFAQPFDWLLPLEADLFDGATALFNGDLAAHRLLAQTLLLSGLGMNFAGGSYPASQSEHLIAHYMEMKLGPSSALHGEQIAVTACDMAFLHDCLLAGPPPRFVIPPLDIRALQNMFGMEQGHECWAEYRQKILQPASMDRVNDLLPSRWSDIVEKLQSCHRSFAEMRRILDRLPASVDNRALGWPDDVYRRAYSEARFIRNRITALDFLGLSGRIEPIVTRMLHDAKA